MAGGIICPYFFKTEIEGQSDNRNRYFPERIENLVVVNAANTSANHF